MDRIAFWELMPPKTTVNGEVYRDFLKHHIRKWACGRDLLYLWIHQDNARPHKHQLVKQYLEENKTHSWPHPAYSPDISPLDYGCFALLKRKLQGIHHNGWSTFERNLEAAVKELNESGSMEAIARLHERWQRAINAQ